MYLTTIDGGGFKHTAGDKITNKYKWMNGYEKNDCPGIVCGYDTVAMCLW